MTRAALGPLALLLALVFVPHAATGPRTAGQRVVAVGDIHGALDGLVQILQAAGLIDAGRRWSGGTARFVQTGDFTDRGRDVRAVMDLLMRLEDEARRAGGRVEVLLGNHEGMNILRDLRDVSPEAYGTFADGRSEDRRRRAFEAHAAIVKRGGSTLDRQEWMATHPAGFVEYVQALGPSGRYGRWIRGRKVAVQIDDTIFMHAGLSPDDSRSLDDVNRDIEREIRAWDEIAGTLERNRLATPTYRLEEIVDAAQVEIGRIVAALKTGEFPGEHVTREYVDRLQQLRGLNTWALIASEGPLWYRGLATLGEEAQPRVQALLDRHTAKRFVTGHTPQLPGSVDVRLGGRVVLIDTGMLASVYKNGRPAALEISEGRLTAIYPSGREPVGGTSGPQP